AGGGLPVHQVESELLLLRVDASEARFTSALERARKIVDAPGEDAGWVRAQRFEAAWRALEIASILGRPRELADALIHHFVDPEPPLLDGSDLAVPEHIAALCVLASAARSARCFTRVHQLRGALSGGRTAETDALL